MSKQSFATASIITAGLLMTQGVVFAQDTGSVSADASVTASTSYSTRQSRTEIELRAREREMRNRASTTADIRYKMGYRHPGGISSTTLDRRDDRRASTTAAREEHRAEIKARLDVRHQQIMQSFGKRLEHRFAAALDRLSMIADRIDARLAKIAMENKTIPTATAHARVAEARVKITAGRAALADLSSTIDAAVASTSPRMAIPSINAAAKKVETDIRAARESLIGAITSIKSGVPKKFRDDEPGTTATSSTSVSATSSTTISH
ncbi:MAG: hypothetical protein ACYC8S_00650 [Minisyncoccota bacterium]